MFGFFGLNMLAIYWAFKIYFRHTRATEEILITPSELHLRRVDHCRQMVEFVFNPLWVRLDQKTHVEFGIEKLYLVSKDRHVSIASSLGSDEKAIFAKALAHALQTAQRGLACVPFN